MVSHLFRIVILLALQCLTARWFFSMVRLFPCVLIHSYISRSPKWFPKASKLATRSIACLRFFYLGIGGINLVNEPIHWQYSHGEMLSIQFGFDCWRHLWEAEMCSVAMASVCHFTMSWAHLLSPLQFLVLCVFSSIHFSRCSMALFHSDVAPLVWHCRIWSVVSCG